MSIPASIFKAHPVIVLVGVVFVTAVVAGVAFHLL